MVGVVTDEVFEQDVIKSDLPVLVDFYADWCGPCKALAPTLESVAQSFDGKVKVLKLNVDDSPATAQKFGVMSIPTLILFKDGEVQQRLMGTKSEQELSAALSGVA